MYKKNDLKALYTKAGHASRLIRNAGDKLSATTLKNMILSCRPARATGSYAFKWDYLEQEILSKFNDPMDQRNTPQDRKERAISKMLDANDRCRQINDDGINVRPEILHMAQNTIGSLLGGVREFLDSDLFLRNASFTGGASVKRRRAQGDPYFKYDTTRLLSVTPKAAYLAKKLISVTPLWREQIYESTPGNCVFTVPKNSDIDRAAAKEPELNQALQSAVGAFIRTRLRSVGINLNDQSINRKLAKVGSITGELATIDLSSASDSISRRIVFELFSNEWYHLFDTLRSPYGRLPDGSYVKWEMISSMGNGFTFELESLIFYALVKATQDYDRQFGIIPDNQATRTVSVYGDDIICASSAYSNVVLTLEGSGFTVNQKKSFASGSFRESCGGHYFNGVSVKPFYIRSPIDGINRIIWLLNAIRAWAADDDGWCDPSVYTLWISLRRRFCPTFLLGGRDTDSIISVASPGEPRYSLMWVPKSREIDGYRAVLRQFQYSSDIVPDCDMIRIRHRKAPYMDLNNPSNRSQDGRKHTLYEIGSREKLTIRQQVSSFWKIPLFPDEAVTWHILNWETS